VALAYVTSALAKMKMHVQNKVHALLSCQDHRVCELRKHFSFCLHQISRASQQLTLFAATGQQPTCSEFPFSAEHYFFLSLWFYLWLAETSQ
jgi:hypothetical protein